MECKQVTVAFFSATGNSKKLAVAVAEGLCGSRPQLLDCTPQGSYQAGVTLPAQQVAVISAPVYAGRIPPAAREHLGRIHGQNTPAVVLVSYGNRDFDDALLELCDLCRENGFVPVAAGAFVGRHTFGKIAVDRPNGQDLQQATALGQTAAKRLLEVSDLRELPELRVKGNRPYKKPMKLPVFAPSTSQSCNRCGLCARLCPTGAIDPKTPDKVDKSRCMSCFACVKCCPKQAKHPHGLLYALMAALLTKKLSKPACNWIFDE